MEPKVLDGRNNNNNIDNIGMQWTNQKHSNFLRVMEARFVRNMQLENSFINDTRLDRFVPDMSESTLDLHKSDRVKRSCNRQKDRPTIRPYKMSHDQVVPQLKNKE
ncbi:unnamed protein product [Amaranthus hypochondriacus]